MIAQNNGNTALPYEKIPDYPENYTPGTVVARMIDGLGFRYYWATEGLRDEDLSFRPVEGSRTIEETLDHILGLSRVILNSAEQVVNDRTQTAEAGLSFEEKRSTTLHNLEKASLIFLAAKDLGEHPIIFRNEKGDTQFPFWNQLNGPLADALWHTGQVVSLRRQAGNPFPAGVSVFTGVRREQ